MARMSRMVLTPRPPLHMVERGCNAGRWFDKCLLNWRPSEWLRGNERSWQRVPHSGQLARSQPPSPGLTYQD